MPTIAELLAKKAAAKAATSAPIAPAVSPTPAPRETMAEKVEMAGVMKRLEAAKKPKAAAPSLILTRELPAATPNGEPRGQHSPIKGPEDFPPRCLGESEGETFDLTPTNADAPTQDWHRALRAFETELCIMTDPKDGERAWLAARCEGLPPILLHSLPIYQHPRTQRPANEPF